MLHADTDVRDDVRLWQLKHTAFITHSIVHSHLVGELAFALQTRALFSCSSIENPGSATGDLRTGQIGRTGHSLVKACCMTAKCSRRKPSKGLPRALPNKYIQQIKLCCSHLSDTPKFINSNQFASMRCCPSVIRYSRLPLNTGHQEECILYLLSYMASAQAVRSTRCRTLESASSNYALDVIEPDRMRQLGAW
jgi:hypothetical protein